MYNNKRRTRLRYLLGKSFSDFKYVYNHFAFLWKYYKNLRYALKYCTQSIQSWYLNIQSNITIFFHLAGFYFFIQYLRLSIIIKTLPENSCNFRNHIYHIYLRLVVLLIIDNVKSFNVKSFIRTLGVSVFYSRVSF